MFDALFCGMQQAAVNADADAPQTQTDSTDSEKITDPHLAILLDSINPSLWKSKKGLTNK